MKSREWKGSRRYLWARVKSFYRSRLIPSHIPIWVSLIFSWSRSGRNPKDSDTKRSTTTTEQIEMTIRPLSCFDSAQVSTPCACNRQHLQFRRTQAAHKIDAHFR